LYQESGFHDSAQKRKEKERKELLNWLVLIKVTYILLIPKALFRTPSLLLKYESSCKFKHLNLYKWMG
jgi:hypothetical protein